jgi:outer membrane protein assembly factor BamB
MLRFVVALSVLALAPANALAQQPLGVVETTLGRFDRDTLRPVGPTISVREPHTGPALSPRGGRVALGVSSPGSPGLPGVGRVGLWIVDPASMTITHEVRTGIAAEAVVYPGVVAALLQDGGLLVVDPDTGRIRSRRHVGYSGCAPPAIHAARRGIIVNQLGPGGAEVAVVEPAGQVRTLRIPIDTSAVGCRRVSLVAGGDRAYLVGRDRVVALDPRARRTRVHRFGDLGRERSAAAVPGGLAVASERGLRLIDTAMWKVRWRDATARSVLASGATVVATGSDVRALDARTGRVRWRAPGHAAAVAAGRVYAQPSVLDLRTGARRGTHPTVTTAIRLISAR